MGLLDWLQPIGDIITSGINAGAVKYTNEQNYDLQQKEWDREDSSYQRKVEDLKRLG